ncbi:GTPase IMAP family member 7-like isoform X2 [Biomphalaria pfeifferi]|uniref:GTPase IMAP family member 7-like isoform X2 n=1 Tax=Biomphalaria pfeifferi TaxID=112525 RepID=A0AAD8B3R4_BIOPF|nr:GTPase IMAP family member 7-like isoform X2 [Biomphalaria pfeifferi]
MGKSLTGNVILGKTVFKDDDQPGSVTEKVEKASAVVDGNNLSVIDTPGVIHIDLNVNEATLKVCKDMTDAVLECPEDGKVALIIVWKYRDRFKQEHKTILSILKQLFDLNQIDDPKDIFYSEGEPRIFDVIRARLEDLQTQVERNIAFRKLEEQIDALLKKLKGLNDKKFHDISNLDEELSSLSSEVERNEDFYPLQQKVGIAKEVLLQMKRNNATIKLRAELDKLRAELDKLRAELDKLRAELDKLRAELDKLRAELDKLRAELDKLRAELDKLRAELDKLRAELDKLRAELDKLRAELDKLRAELDKLRAELDKLRAELDKLRAELDKLRAELDKLRKKVENTDIRTYFSKRTFGPLDTQLFKLTIEILKENMTLGTLHEVNETLEDVRKCLNYRRQDNLQWKLFTSQSAIYGAAGVASLAVPLIAPIATTVYALTVLGHVHEIRESRNKRLRSNKHPPDSEDALSLHRVSYGAHDYSPRFDEKIAVPTNNGSQELKSCITVLVCTIVFSSLPF